METQQERKRFRFFTSCESIVILFFLIKYQNKMTQYNTLNVKLSNSQINKLNLESEMVLK